MTSTNKQATAFPEYSLGGRIKELRERLELSQAAFAKKVNLSQPTVSQIENGGDPSVSTLQKIADGLDVDIAVLFAKNDVHVFDMKRLKANYKSADDMSPYLYTALSKVVNFGKEMGL